MQVISAHTFRSSGFQKTSLSHESEAFSLNVKGNTTERAHTSFHFEDTVSFTIWPQEDATGPTGVLMARVEGKSSSIEGPVYYTAVDPGQDIKTAVLEPPTLEKIMELVGRWADDVTRNDACAQFTGRQDVVGQAMLCNMLTSHLTPATNALAAYRSQDFTDKTICFLIDI